MPILFAYSGATMLASNDLVAFTVLAQDPINLFALTELRRQRY
jgi:hypothetical protein